jgi:hypothetical protein
MSGGGEQKLLIGHLSRLLLPIISLFVLSRPLLLHGPAVVRVVRASSCVPSLTPLLTRFLLT